MMRGMVAVFRLVIAYGSVGREIDIEPVSPAACVDDTC